MRSTTPSESSACDPAPQATHRRAMHAVLAAASVWIAALIQWGLVLGWDEIEYYRATRWVAQGQLPFLDFWEHHAPLQWFLFAPVAWIADWPGAASIVLMRWAQVVLWVGIFILLMTVARRTGSGLWARRMTLALLLVSVSFVTKAIEYRVDVPGNLAYLGAIVLVLFVQTRRRWIVFGVLMSLSALANMRLAPLIIVTAALMLVWRSNDERWGVNLNALWMAAGVAPVALLFLGFYAAHGAVGDLMRDLVHLNLTTNKYQFPTFGTTLLTPVWRMDLAAIVFWIAGLAAILRTFRFARAPKPLHIFAILSIASILTIWQQGVHYEYHFQTTYLLLFPLASSWLTKVAERSRWIVLLLAVLAFAFNSVRTMLPSFGGPMAYQDVIMRTADASTLPSETVWDGVGYALRRRPACRFWFLPAGIRFLSAEGRLPPFDAPQMIANPPGAVIADDRVLLWFEVFPHLQSFVTRHYLPLYRNLWIPGMTAKIEPRPKRFVWRVVKSGHYDVYVSDLLMKHPWLRDPVQYTKTQGTRAAMLEIPLRRLAPLPGASLRWRIDGRDIDGAKGLDLRRGSNLELVASAPLPAGVLIVPTGVGTLCRGPKEEFQF